MYSLPAWIGSGVVVAAHFSSNRGGQATVTLPMTKPVTKLTLSENKVPTEMPSGSFCALSR